jgi:dTDP-4-amino-4,6-dideoxygalactose transaminase
VATKYGQLLANIEGLKLPMVADGREHVWHLYAVLHEQRDALARHLGERGIQTVVNYPLALPFLPAYRRLGHTPIDFPVAHYHQSRVLSLPIFPEITDEQLEYVASSIAEFGNGH